MSPRSRAAQGPEVDATGQRELSELQHWMAEQLMAARGLNKLPDVVEHAARQIGGNEGLAPVEQLEIYREQFWLRHTGSLVEDFPGVSGVLGQTDWQRLVESYLLCYPPASYTLRDLGCHMAGHIDQCDWLPEQALLGDMARLELAYIELFDAKDSEPIAAQKIAAVPEHGWETARLVLDPSLQFVSSRYPVSELRLALLRNQRLAETGGELSSVPLPPPKPEHLVLYRGKLTGAPRAPNAGALASGAPGTREMYRELLSPAAFALLTRLRDGVPLVPACEAVMAEQPSAAAEVEANVGPWFQRWASLGFVIDVLVD